MHCRVYISSTIKLGSLGFHRQIQVNIPIVWISVSWLQDYYSMPYTFGTARERSLYWVSGAVMKRHKENGARQWDSNV
jgi:hypothetical protein